MRKLGKVVLAALAITATPALSSSATGLLVSKIRVDSNGNALVVFNNTLGAYPCASAFNNSMAFVVTTETGRTMLSALMSAKLAGRTVDVVGTGTCNIYGTNVEGLNYFTVN